jgi:hypothetical protein
MCRSGRPRTVVARVIHQAVRRPSRTQNGTPNNVACATGRSAERRVGIGLADAEQHSPTSEVGATETPASSDIP